MKIMMEYYKSQMKHTENMDNLELNADQIQEIAMKIMAQEGYITLLNDPKLEALLIQCSIVLTGVVTATEFAVKAGDHVSPRKMEPSFYLLMDLFEHFVEDNPPEADSYKVFDPFGRLCGWVNNVDDLDSYFFNMLSGNIRSIGIKVYIGN